MSSRAAPRVVITAGTTTNAAAYEHSLERSGAEPVVLRPGDRVPALESFDAIVLAGGPDVQPERFGETIPADLEGQVHVDVERDLLEFAVLEKVERLGLPVLAICRGVQLLNVSRGGTLRLDLTRDGFTAIDHRQPDRREETVHKVLVLESRLRSVVGTDQLAVNSIHHQSILIPAPDLRVVARATDGVIEGVESEDGRLVGVQWHPELLFDTHAAARAVFADLLERVEARTAAA